jgi:hypothetical protein
MRNFFLYFGSRLIPITKNIYKKLLFLLVYLLLESGIFVFINTNQKYLYTNAKIKNILDIH